MHILLAVVLSRRYSEFFYRRGTVATGLLAVAILAGCAAQANRAGKLQLSIDEAELLGQTLHSFRLVDGNEGRIRRLGDAYSVKLQQYLRVIPIAKATAVAFVDARPVGGRTLLVLNKSERNCAFKTQIMAISGAQVSGWDFGDCATAPKITYADSLVHFDFNYRGRGTRYTYADGKLMKGEPPKSDSSVAEPADADPVARLADDMPRFSPPPPIPLGTSRTAAVPHTLPPVSRPALKKTSLPTTPAKPNLVFKEEQKATIILILDK